MTLRTRMLNRRLEPYATTIFSEMSRLAERTGAVNLGQGFPDTDGPREIIESAARAMHGGHNQYPPVPGYAPLRRAIAEHQHRFYGIDLDPDREVQVTTGATEGVAASLLALCEPGDEVIALEPFYDSYAAVIAMAGATLVPVTLRPPDFRFDLDELRSAVTARTRLVLLNSPHNPTGAVLSRTELEDVAEVVADHELMVVTDEVYEHLTYDPQHPHIPLATLPGMSERTLTVSSAAKSFSFTGWKVGWVTGPAEAVAAVRTVKQYLTFAGSAPFQPAVAEALCLPDEYFTSFQCELRRKRDLLADALTKVGFEVFRPRGTYFITTDITPLGEADGVAFCSALPWRCGVVAVPSSVFYSDANRGAGESLVRFAFCKTDEVLDEAISRLQRLVAWTSR